MIVPDLLALPACQQVIHQLFYFLDESDYPRLLELFTPEGSWERQGELLTGRAMIQQALSKRPKTQRIRHVLSNCFLASAGQGSAQLVAYMTAYRFDSGRLQTGPAHISRPLRLSVLRARLQVRHGDWRVAEMRLTPEFEFVADMLPEAVNG